MKYPLIPLGDIAVISGGSVNPQQFPNETFQLFSIPAYDEHNADIIKGSHIGSAKKCVQPHDVLLSRIVPHIRRCWVVPGKGDYRQIASSEWIVFRTDRFNPKCLQYFLLSDPFHSQFMQTVSGVGGSLLRARPAQVYQIKIPLPPLAEQKRIASILDAADKLRKQRKQNIAMLDKLLQATFLEMFGDPVVNPKGWEVRKLDEVCEIRRGASPRPIKNFTGGNVPWIKIGDATKGDDIYISDTAEKITEEGAKKSVFLKKGSLIFANCGVSLGFARILNINGCIHDGWLSIENLHDDIHQIFLLKWVNFKTDYFRSIAPDGTQPNLNIKIMKQQKVYLPPLTLQSQFAKIVEKVEAQKALQQAHLAELDTLFASLQQKAFAGDL